MKKWFHLIGVSGKTTANIAKVFQDQGWFVTGSDNQFSPPASDILIENKINTAEGYNFKHLTRDFWVEKLNNLTEEDIPENPDLVLFISHLSIKNKEYLYAKKKGLNIQPYAKILNKYLIKEESIVVIGSAGKTTTTALTTFILQKLDLNPSYMIGADVVDISDSLEITDSKFSVMEGDEYHNPAPEIEGKAKFLEYKPKYLIITNIGWEHQDIFPTQERYVEEFGKAVELVPEDGLIVAKLEDANIDKVIQKAKPKVIRYQVVDSKEEVSSDERKNIWSLLKGTDDYHTVYNEYGIPILEFKTKLLGDYNLENILAVVILILNFPSNIIPVDLIRQGSNLLEIISKSISEFNGVKKRLERLLETDNLIVIDDFGVAPSRAINSLKTIKNRYSEYNIISVFEPNSGSRPLDKNLFNQMYKDTFTNSELVIIPDLSENPELVGSEEMVERLVELGFNARYVNNVDLNIYISNYLKEKKGKYVIVFFSSYRLTKTAKNFVEDNK